MQIDHWNASSWNLISRRKQLAKLKSTIPENPESFTEKVRFRMAYDRRPVLAQFADKYQIRKYVENTVGAGYLANVLDVARVPEKISWKSLPENFVCKTNHGSGGMVGVWTGVELSASLPTDHSHLGWTRWWVHPNNFDSRTCQSMMNYWLHQNYAYRSIAYPEWAYASIGRRIYIEELLQNANGTIASPYYFYIFSGKTKVIHVSGRDLESSRYVAFMDRNWNHLDIGNSDFQSHKKITPPPQAPINFDEMLRVAETLTNGIDFARVDLYNIDGRIVFSESTNYPGAGQSPWIPQEYEFQMGQFWSFDVINESKTKHHK